MLSGEATNTNFIVFGLTRPRLEPTIYRTQGEHAHHYTTEIRLSSFLKCLPLKEELIRASYIFFELLFTSIYDLNTNVNSRRHNDLI
jgi:hypothetical protein